MNSACSLTIGEDGCGRLEGALTFASVPGLYHHARDLLENQKSFNSLDLDRVTTADSAGLALLLEWQATQTTPANKLPIRNAPAGLISLARLCEADEFLDLSARSSGQ
ncbi:MAG: STAS domain-containing protein [Xanthomonadales bacterium]|nr:STAS domain-containing protein [Gammaproteobacteria bacterium]MBT8052476.1 STAS domain-containing protein [Gammaproteobacteria bacterium]NND57150.1 STAS domain-containing protein [Xanthomonadales bacterium]NNK52800.1 STAS domain-containing protein [Xanthomonadales bacterium]